MKFVTSKKKAFTFVELLIVIVIIGVLTGLAVPQLKKTFNDLELESFTKDIYFLSRYLQGSAIGQGMTYYLNIDKQNCEFSASYLEEGVLRKAQGRFSRAYKAPGEITISMDPQEKQGIFFYPDGSIDNITLTFSNPNNKKLFLIIKGAAGDIKVKQE